jgi:small subunit ribosomal protein S6
MRHYELMVILDPELEERTVTPSLETYSQDHQRQQEAAVDKLDCVGPSPYDIRDSIKKAKASTQ